MLTKIFKKTAIVTPMLAVSLGLAAQSNAAEIELFGTAKVKPTYYTNFDFDNNKDDGVTLNEGGLVSGNGAHTRNETRLGWKAKGDDWSVKMIAEVDQILTKDNVDRSYYVGALKEDIKPNAGSEFGIERAEFLYSFSSAVQLQAGWDIRYLDLKSGGLLYGDDHPFLGLRGKSNNTSYELLYIPIENSVRTGSGEKGDWRVYTAKVSHDVTDWTLSPILAYSDNVARDAGVTYFGLEGFGKIGGANLSFELIGAEGDVGTRDLSSSAAYAGLEFPVNNSFKPYVAVRYTQGDSDATDNKVEGFNGITDIGRFSGLMGMDGNVLGENLGVGYGATLYAYAPERTGGKGVQGYGGIGNGASGINPGSQILAFGTKGALASLSPNLSYKAQLFMIWFDETNNLINLKNASQKVDDYAGTTVDVQLKYAFHKNFSIDYIFSTFVPGDGIQDQTDSNDNVFVNTLSMNWTY